jgi:hypothetical protein
MQSMTDTVKYFWGRVALGYGLLCPAMAGVFFLILGFLAQPEKFESLLQAVHIREFVFQWEGLIVLLLFPLGGILFFGIPYLIFALFFIGFKVRQGWPAYGFAATWGGFLGSFWIFGIQPLYAISRVEAYFGLGAAFSLALAGVVMTYLVVPPKDGDE